MVKRRGNSKRRTITRYIKKRGGRRPKRNDLKKYAKKAALGTVAGLAVAIPVSLAAKYLGRPELVEVADRAGAVAAGAIGGTAGQISYQIADAVFDRFVVFGGQSISGGNQSYL